LRKILLFLINIIMISTLFSQTEWINFNQNNTLFPSNPYKVIAIDNNANKWIGTEYKGLLKFDGTNWETFDTSNSGLSSNKINHLCFDEFNNLWIATTTGGLVKKTLDDSMTIFNTSNSFLPTNDINHIERDDFNTKWISTKNGLVLWDSFDNSTIFNTSNSELPTNDITTTKAVTEYIYNPNTDTLDTFYTKWIGTTNGLVRYNNNIWEIFTTSNSIITGNGITALQIDAQKNKWIGVYNWNSNSGGGLIKIDSTNTQWTVYTETNSLLPSNNIRSINYELDNEGNSIIWIATNNGIARFFENQWTIYNQDNTQNNISTNNIYAIAIENNMKWFGTDYNMLKLAESAWTNFNILNAGIPNDNIIDIIFNQTENYSHKWIATKNGLTRFDGTNWKVFNMANSSLPSNDIKSVAIDNNQKIWIGTQQFGSIGGGLCSYDAISQQWNIYNTVNSNLTSNSINKIIVNKANNLKWIGTAGGGLLSLDDNNNWQIFTTDNSQLNSNYIQDILIDSYNKIWIATNFGLTVFDENTNFVITYNTFNSNLQSNNILKIKQDNYGYIWAITPNCVGKLINQNWKIFHKENSPLIGNISDIAFDSENIKWITTNQGLFRTDEIQWDTYNTNNSQIYSNKLNAINIEQIFQNNRVFNHKWIATADSGIVILKGEEQLLNSGAYLSVLQHSITPNVLSISGIINNIVADSVHFKVNDLLIENRQIAQNTWITNYQADKSENLIIEFTYFSDLGDSTISKDLNISLLNDASDPVKINKFNIVPVTNLYQNKWLLSFNEQEKLYIPELPNELTNNLKLSYYPEDNSSYLFQYRAENNWINLITHKENNSFYTLISKEGNYRVVTINENTPPINNISIYPNPLNISQNKSSNLNLSFDLITDSKLKIEIFNIKGQKVKTIQNEILSKGNHIINWDGKNNFNQTISTGVYFMRIKGKSINTLTKFAIIK